ncbi:MAG TPA: AsmA family protein [Candidatus Angelobacter sp.]|nr:AsmA family protein [Candidatus Angelobacter sp.]
MADATSAAPQPGPRKRASWWRTILFVLILVAVLLVVLYFVARTSEFFQKQILPRVSKALHAEVTVKSAEVHPFSMIVLHDLKVQPTNQPPILTAREVRVKYSLVDILAGNFHVDEIAVVSPVLQVVENRDGSSNLDPLLKAESGKRKAESGKREPARVNVRKVTISNASVLRILNHPNGTRDLVEVTNLDVTASGIRNGGAGKVELAAIVRDENNPPAPAMYGLLQANVGGKFDFSLTPELGVASVLGDARVEIAQAAGAFSDFQKMIGTLHCDASAQEIKGVSLSFEREDVPLGELRASGPFNLQTSEGRLNVELLSVDKQVLNLFGAKIGFDFGSTTITLTNQIDVAKGGAAIGVVGALSASQFQLSRTNQSTPALDLRADYNVSVDNTEKTVLLRTLSVAGTQKGRALLHGQLTSPMMIAWGNKTNAVGDSALSLAVTKLNLADWKVFLGALAPAGTLDLHLKLLSQEGGKRLTFDVTNQIQNLTVEAGGGRLNEVAVALKTHGQAMSMEQFDLSDFSLQLAKSNRVAVAISGSGTYNKQTENADLQVDARGAIPRALELAGETNLVASSGGAELKARVTQDHASRAVKGTLTLTNFTGKFAGDSFTNFGTTMALDVGVTPQQIDIREAKGTLMQNRKSGGGFDLSGTYSLTNRPSQFSVTLDGLNENGVRPFLAPLLAGRRLVSVSLNGTASAQRSANGDSALKANVVVTNLVVNDPARKFPASPLEAKVQVDASLAKSVMDLRQLQVGLTPTKRATNQFEVRGRVDMSKTNAITGQLTLSADSLDVTRYYDLLAGTNTIAKSVPKVKGRSMSAAGPEAQTAGATNQLPFRNFTVAANVRALYLREIAGSNFQANVKLDGSRILLRPFQLTLDGSPVVASADVDLGVPGYKYALTFDATNAPLGPLWNTFKPEEKRKVGGTLSAQLDLNGVGTSGESLQKSLKGNFNIGTTNLNLDVSKIRGGILGNILGDIVTIVAKAPELFGENGAGAAESLGLGFVKRSLGNLNGGMAKDVSQSPIETITARGTAGDGKVTVEHAVVRSTVFVADVTNGTVTLARELTNSTINLPISIWLSQPVAQRIPYLSSVNTETNGGFMKLPDFYVEKGTLGDPKPSLNVSSLGKKIIQEVPGLGGTNGVSGNLLNTLGGLLKGGANTNNVSTNGLPATNALPMENLFNRFLGPK